MRVRDVLVLGALAISAMACGDSLAPEAREGRDLDFVLPTVAAEPPDETRYRTWDEPVSASDIAKLRGMRQANLDEGSPNDDGSGGDGGGTGGGGGGSTDGGGGEPLAPLITDHYAIGRFEGDLAKIEYGLYGFGTGYTMTPALKVYGANQTEIANETGTGRSEDASFFSYMHPVVQESILVPVWCGATAQLKVKFEVRLSVVIFTKRVSGQEQAHDDFIFAQPACASRPAEGDGGGGGGIGGGGPPPPRTGGGDVYICFYEEWVDQNGVVIEKILLGCKYIGGEFLRV